MDSAVAAAIARETSDVLLLHANYGQRTQARELRAFHALADRWAIGGAARLVVDFTSLKAIGGSSLTDERIPVRHGAPVAGEIPATYVPFRNAHLLSAAVSWAEVAGASSVVIGAVEADSSGYPDCRAEFFRSFEAAVRLGTRPETRISIETPVIGLSKSAIVRRGLALGVPFDLTWSCYEGSEEACGACESCVLRLRGFAEAGAQDPIPYRASRRA
jgi:7-cyano-7-deazaguanine synthase